MRYNIVEYVGWRGCERGPHLTSKYPMPNVTNVGRPQCDLPIGDPGASPFPLGRGQVHPKPLPLAGVISGRSHRQCVLPARGTRRHTTDIVGLFRARSSRNLALQLYRVAFSPNRHAATIALMMAGPLYQRVSRINGVAASGGGSGCATALKISSSKNLEHQTILSDSDGDQNEAACRPQGERELQKRP